MSEIMKIVAHTMVKNEENWVGYALKSVIDYVDEIMIWDTGSTDKTVEVIKSLNNPKIVYRKIETNSEVALTELRQKMLEQTKADWLMVLDGDEIWPDKAIENTINFIKTNSELEYVVNPYFDLIGDVYHCRDASTGHYKIHDKSGQITIRFVNLKKIPGLHWGMPYGSEGLFDKDESPIQNRNNDNYKFVDSHFLHASHLVRSSFDSSVMQRPKKYKFELGVGFPDEFEYPSCFYIPVAWHNPWLPRGVKYTLISLVLWPIQFIKHTFLDK